MDSRIWIVMRAHNDIALLGQTLDALAVQDVPHRLLVLDNASTDGTTELARARSDRLCTIARGSYVPGQVLNFGMQMTTGDLVVFLNSDCMPVDAHWLRHLIAPFEDPAVSATFGSQEPRPGCDVLAAKDIHDTYGPENRQQRWRNCFSMASSAIRRSAWQDVPFDDKLAYSEDIDWSWRVRQRGGAVRYVPASRVLHSHSYTLAQAYRRHEGEGRAEARIFDWTPWSSSLLRYTMLPFARQVWSDWCYCARERALAGAVHAPLVRLVQLMGRRAGFIAGRSADRGA